MSSLFAYFASPMDLIIVGVVVLLLFGNRLPSVMRSLGRGVVEFKKGVAGIEDELDEATRVSSTKKSEAIEEAPKVSSSTAAEVKKTEA